MTHARERRALVDTVRWLMARGLYAGTSGNVSLRVGGRMLITPTGVACDDVDAGALVELAVDRTPRTPRTPRALRGDGTLRGALAPSSEWRIHRDIYRRRPEVGAVVHTHSTFATAYACLRRPLPAFHYMIAKAGGAEIRCARYATYGTEALSRNALAALEGRQACLLANHGLLALGGDLRTARLLAEEIEALAAQYAAARAMGRPVLLPAREMRAVRARFADYGQPARNARSTLRSRGRP
jgi:L-fuculose-phosphate aldolase